MRGLPAREAVSWERQQLDGKPFLLPVVCPMARYYFDLFLGAFMNRDEVGSEIGSLHVADIEARRTAGELTRDRLIQLQNAASEKIRVEVRDEHRQTVLAVTVSIQVERAPLTPSCMM
jgi:hypothetical protein